MCFNPGDGTVVEFFKCRDTLGAKLNIRYLSQFAVDLPEFKSYVSYFIFKLCSKA